LSTFLRRPWGWIGFYDALGSSQVEVNLVASVSLVAFPVTFIPLPVSVPSTFLGHYPSDEGSLPAS